MGDRRRTAAVALLIASVLATTALAASALGGGAGSAQESAAPASGSATEPVLAPAVQYEVVRAPAYLPAGAHEHQLDVDGQVRRWTTVVPPAAMGSRPPALVVVLHGVGEQGAKMRLRGFDPLAAEQGVVMAYPDAFGGAWNDGRPGAEPMVPGVTVDDSRFLRLLIEETVTATGADTRRVAVVGLSNGAMMAGRVACDLADRVSAVALVVGSGGQGFEETCRPARPVAVMVVAGSADASVPYAGGKVADFAGKRRGYVAGAEAFFDFWRIQNGCTATQLIPGTSVSEARGTDCRSGNAVLRYRVEGGTHEWYQAPRFDTTNAVWAFVVNRFAAAA